MESPFDRRDRLQRSPPRSNTVEQDTVLKVSSINTGQEKSREEASSTMEITEENILQKYAEEMEYFDELLDSKTSKKGIIDKVKDRLSKWIIRQVKQAAKIEILEKENEELKKKLANKEQENKTTYAEILRERPVQLNNTEKQIMTSRTKPKHVILIKGKHGEQAKNIQQEIVKVLDPKKDKMKIKSCRITTKAVVLETATAEDAEKILNNTELKHKFTCEKQKKKNPLMILYNVPTSMKEEEITEFIHEQNFEHMSKEEFEKSFTLRFKTGPRNAPTVHHVAEVTGAMRNEIKAKHRLFLQFNSIVAKDFIQVAKCNNCQDLNHIAKFCSKEQVCSHCGTHDHNKKDCPDHNMPAKCIPCLNRKKKCNAKTKEDCQTYLLLKQRLIDNTNYG